ncbi:MAG TPA: IclR family transcriptional regulator [Solirubrobacteraceae bacterium]|nr:IclR family transcriptional regulator [Solirubrobacteraceae bacterium]
MPEVESRHDSSHADRSGYNRRALVSPQHRGTRPADGVWLPSELDDKRYSQSLLRGLSILESFTSTRPLLGVAEIADPMGMSRSTAHRYLMTLVAFGYLEQTVDRRYRLGLRVIDLGMSALSSADPGKQAESYLTDLRERTGYSASLAILDRTEIVYMARARSFKRGQHEIDHNIRVGSRSPAYCTAMGKVLLANLPSPVQNEVIYEIELKRRGSNTITTKKELRAELERVREDGLAVNDQELHDGLVAIASGVRDRDGEVTAAISLAAHVSMIPLHEMVDALGPHLTATADQISGKLGYRRADEVSR